MTSLPPDNIPRGLPYLTGLVTAMEIEAEAAWSGQGPAAPRITMPGC